MPPWCSCIISTGNRVGVLRTATHSTCGRGSRQEEKLDESGGSWARDYTGHSTLCVTRFWISSLPSSRKFTPEGRSTPHKQNRTQRCRFRVTGDESGGNIESCEMDTGPAQLPTWARKGSVAVTISPDDPKTCCMAVRTIPHPAGCPFNSLVNAHTCICHRLWNITTKGVAVPELKLIPGFGVGDPEKVATAGLDWLSRINQSGCTTCTVSSHICPRHENFLSADRG